MASWIPGELLNVGRGTRLALPFIRGAVRAGIGSTATYKFLREAGLGARKQDVLAAHKALSYALKDTSVYIPEDTGLKPRAEVIPLSMQSQKRPYSIVGYIDRYDQSTGTVERQHITLDDDVLQTTQDYLDLIAEVGIEYLVEGQDILDVGIDHMAYTDNPTIGAF